jgi:dTDP-4-amino-4,6-dideoxygalactose transaminase
VLAFRALGIGPGDEVITAPNSFFATAEAIALAGATPVFADVLDDTLLIDPAEVAKKIGPKTRAIVPVHLYGQCADVPALRKLTQGTPIAIVEDACQAHGSDLGGQRAGSLGHAAAFSFYPTKNLGALGEGGAITTGSAEIASRVRVLRDHGQKDKHRHELVAYNARLDALQCACLSVKLRVLDDAAAARRAVAARYRAGLDGAAGVRVVAETAGSRHVYHLFVVRVAKRDDVGAKLKAAGVETAHLGHKSGAFPVAEKAVGEILSLPMFPEMTMEQVDEVVARLREIVG